MKTEYDPKEHARTQLSYDRQRHLDSLAIIETAETILSRLPSLVIEMAAVVNGALMLYGCDRDRAMEVMHILSAGKWNREVSADGDRLNYSATVNGIPVEIYRVPPPASCRIEETPVYVPAHNRIERKLVCA